MKESVGKITIAVENRGKNAIAPIYMRLLPPYHYKRCMLSPCHRNFKKFLHAIEESSLYLSVIAVKLTPNTS